MRQVLSIVVVVASWSGFANGLMGQTALEKLERRLESQARRAAAKVADPAEQGYLGVSVDRNAAGEGVRIVKLTQGGPAARAGLKVGDVVTALDGDEIATMDDFARAIAGTPAGSTLLVEVTRDDRRYPIEVVLTRRPSSAARGVEKPAAAGLPQADRPMALLGVVVDEVTAKVRDELELDDVEGAVVLRLVPGGAAEEAGVPVEAVIVAVDGRPVGSPSDLRRWVAQAGPGAEITLVYLLKGKRVELPVMLAMPADAPPPRLAKPPETDLPLDDGLEEERIGRLERRVDELEARLRALERLLQSTQPAPRPRKNGKE